jgi:hypothetical protein
MSMMMPPDPNAGAGMPLPPGGGAPGLPPPPMDAMSSTPLPAEGGIEGLIAALQGGGAAGPGGPSPLDPAAGGGLPSDPTGPGGPGGLGPALGAGDDSPDMADMTPVEHIQHAMKHLMMAMASSSDDEQGVGITKGMGALQALLGGEQKKQKLLASAGG